MDIIQKALERSRKQPPAKGGGEKKGSSSPLREATREAWDAMQKGDFDSFSEAFESALRIKMSE